MFTSGSEASTALILAYFHPYVKTTGPAEYSVNPLKCKGSQAGCENPAQTVQRHTEAAVADITPLTDWNPLVPEPKRPALNTRINKKGHPPRGDQK